MHSVKCYNIFYRTFSVFSDLSALLPREKNLYSPLNIFDSDNRPSCSDICQHKQPFPIMSDIHLTDYLLWRSNHSRHLVPNYCFLAIQYKVGLKFERFWHWIKKNSKVFNAAIIFVSDKEAHTYFVMLPKIFVNPSCITPSLRFIVNKSRKIEIPNSFDASVILALNFFSLWI